MRFIRYALILVLVCLLTVSASFLPFWQTLRQGSEQALSQGIGSPLIDPYLVSGRFAEGEKAMLARLISKPDDDKARFGLGAVQLMQGVEHLMQSLFRYGLRDNSFRTFIPILRLPVPENPKPEVLTYDRLQSIFQTWVADLAKVQATLEPIKDPNVKLPLRVGLIRLDFDGDGKADVEESLWRVFATVTGANITEADARQFLIAFDAGDALWLQGYSHVLGALGEFLLAYDRREIFEACAHMFFAKVDTPHKFLFEGRNLLESGSGIDFVDAIAAIHLMRFPVAEAQRMTTVLNHLKAVTQLSRKSWQAIVAETDNDREWLPNAKQTGVIPDVRISQEAIDSWQSFLNEADTLLSGKRLIPFWRSKDNKLGINLSRVFTEPRTMDLVLWVQGTAATPYLEKGKLTDFQVWNRLFNVFGGNLFGFAIWFN
ncbi:EF-hand domain-containing protein [Tumidithrix helvetica PCC 7403]|uniref:hypothetical protein n=1 Tax=Tumidithrix helvetica TaxID=3457545 RepID=UPI003CA9C34B